MKKVKLMAALKPPSVHNRYYSLNPIGYGNHSIILLCVMNKNLGQMCYAQYKRTHPL